MNQTVTKRIDGSVATLTLNRPAALNALNPDMAEALRNSLQQVEGDATVRCVVICGSSGHFMAGGDVTYFRDALARSSDSLPEEIFDNVHAAIRILRGMPKPVIASVNGACAGFGLSLMVACDLSIVADDTQFTLAYCHVGASPDGGSTFFLPRIVGLKRAMELILLGERFDSNAASSMGLVNKVVRASDLEQETQALAARLAAGPAFAFAEAKALVNTSLHSNLDDQLDAEKASFLECAKTRDFAEGVNAFCEKRKPKFSK
jgi:2-(1,2-epoxy-1,2-dihydrophenyl)acetyl-CoA isomerase